jgi:hypothetical protein
MRHLLLSKSLTRSIGALPSIQSATVSLGAASHTLTVRALQLTALMNSTIGVQYAPIGEREAVYPVKEYAGRKNIDTVIDTIHSIVGGLADNHNVQLVQSAAANEYRLRYTRCGLSDKMRLLNEVLPEFDFDPFTTNISLRCVRGSKSQQENVMRLHGLPIRIGKVK